MRTITVHEHPGCLRCDATFRAFDTAGVDDQCVDPSADPAAGDHVRAPGHVPVPVVPTPDGSSSGFRPDPAPPREDHPR